MRRPITGSRRVSSAVQSNPAAPSSSGIDSLEVRGGVLAAREEPGDAAVVLGGLGIGVDQVQSAAGAQHPKDLDRGGDFRVAVEMVQHQRRQHPVEFTVGIRQLLGVTVVEANPSLAVQLSSRPSQCEWVGVDSDHVGYAGATAWREWSGCRFRCRFPARGDRRRVLPARPAFGGPCRCPSTRESTS